MSWPHDPSPEGAPSGDPAGHVGHLAVEFAEGRLEPAAAQRVVAHLDECAACRADVEFARALRQRTLASHLRHVPAQRLVELAENAALGPTDEEFAHLERCELCRRQLDWARSVPLPIELAEEAAAAARAADLAPQGATGPHPARDAGAAALARDRQKGGFRLRPALWWRWGAVAAAAAALVILLRPSGPQQQVQQLSSLASLARIEPLPVRMQRAGGEAEDFDGLYARGLSAYRTADYAAAAEALGRAVSLDPSSAAAHLYLGSALLQLGRTSDAISHLERAAQVSDAPSLADGALWLLANACLSLEDRACATERLRTVAALGGAHGSAAQQLLDAIGAR